MEKLEAGSWLWSDCADDSALAIVGAVSIGLLALSNPVGWAAIAGGVITVLSGGASGASLVANGNCF